MISYWLVKSEPSTYSIGDLRREKKTAWQGVRNYQARNYMKKMKLGDFVLFYHSNTENPGVYGSAKVTKKAFADTTAFDKKSPYYDPKATSAEPRWYCPEISFHSKLSQCYSLKDIKNNPKLAGMPLLKRGSRLSVMPISAKEFAIFIEQK